MTKNKHRPSHEVEAELRALRKEAAALKIEIAEIKEAMKEKQTRLEQLTGGVWTKDYTLIDKKKGELESAKRWEADAGKPAIVWLVAPSLWGNDENEFIVSRVTPKRIYIRKRGDSHETIYNRDGTAQYGSAVINVEATLGQVVNP